MEPATYLSKPRGRITPQPICLTTREQARLVTISGTEYDEDGKEAVLANAANAPQNCGGEARPSSRPIIRDFSEKENVQGLEEEEENRTSTSQSDESEEEEDDEDDDEEDNEEEADSDTSADNEYSNMSDNEIEPWLEEFMNAQLEAFALQESLEEEAMSEWRDEQLKRLRLIGAKVEVQEELAREERAYQKKQSRLLDRVEKKSLLLCDKLEKAGVTLFDLYKRLGDEAASAACTETWRTRVCWAGQAETELQKSLKREAEEDLKTKSPLLLNGEGQHVGKGASGFESMRLATIQRQLAAAPGGARGARQRGGGGSEHGSKAPEAMLPTGGTDKGTLSAAAAAAAAKEYLEKLEEAETPQEAAALGIALSAADVEVDEIGELGVGYTSRDLKHRDYAAAFAREDRRWSELKEQPQINKICEDDDVKETRRQARQDFSKRRRSRQRSGRPGAPPAAARETAAAAATKYHQAGPSRPPGGAASAPPEARQGPDTPVAGDSARPVSRPEARGSRNRTPDGLLQAHAARLLKDTNLLSEEQQHRNVISFSSDEKGSSQMAGMRHHSPSPLAGARVQPAAEEPQVGSPQTQDADVADPHDGKWPDDHHSPAAAAAAGTAAAAGGLPEKSPAGSLAGAASGCPTSLNLLHALATEKLNQDLTERGTGPGRGPGPESRLSASGGKGGSSAARAATNAGPCAPRGPPGAGMPEEATGAGGEGEPTGMEMEQAQEKELARERDADIGSRGDLWGGCTSQTSLQAAAAAAAGAGAGAGAVRRSRRQASLPSARDNEQAHGAGQGSPAGSPHPGPRHLVVQIDSDGEREYELDASMLLNFVSRYLHRLDRMGARGLLPCPPVENPSEPEASPADSTVQEGAAPAVTPETVEAGGVHESTPPAPSETPAPPTPPAHPARTEPTLPEAPSAPSAPSAPAARFHREEAFHERPKKKSRRNGCEGGGGSGSSSGSGGSEDGCTKGEDDGAGSLQDGATCQAAPAAEAEAVAVPAAAAGTKAGAKAKAGAATEGEAGAEVETEAATVAEAETGAEAMASKEAAVKAAAEAAPAVAATTVVVTRRAAAAAAAVASGARPGGGRRGGTVCKCTACGKENLAGEVKEHPLLSVALCSDCSSVYIAERFSKGKDNSDEQCSWCAWGGVLLLCDGCDAAFCQDCIARNLGHAQLRRIREADPWACFVCDPSPLADLQSLCRQAQPLQKEGKTKRRQSQRRGGDDSLAGSSEVSHEDGETSPKEDAEEEVPAAAAMEEEEGEGEREREGQGKEAEREPVPGPTPPSARKTHKRQRIRKVMKEEELNEETRRKLQLEEERQKRLEQYEEEALAREARASQTHVGAHHPPVEEEEAPPADGAANDDDNDDRDSDEDSGAPEEQLAINDRRAAGDPPVYIDRHLAKKLRPHQVDGVRFMWDNCIQSVQLVRDGDPGMGCILAHTMGLGKTLQVIVFLHTVLRQPELRLRTALVVLPVNVLVNWEQEFLHWQKPCRQKLPVVTLDESVSNNKQRARHIARWRETGGVLLMGYRMFRNLTTLSASALNEETRQSLLASLQDPGADVLVCDEAHLIKNEKSGTTRALKTVRTQRRIALTGSPLQNNLGEYYCMVDFVRQGHLGTPKEFRNQFDHPISFGQQADSKPEDVKTMKERVFVLHDKLKGFVQRKGVDVVRSELPAKAVFVLSARLSPLQRQLYRAYVRLQGLQEGVAVAEDGDAGSRLFSVHAALSKIWNHPEILRTARRRAAASATRATAGRRAAACAEVSQEGVGTQPIVQSERKTTAAAGCTSEDSGDNRGGDDADGDASFPAMQKERAEEEDEEEEEGEGEGGGEELTAWWQDMMPAQQQRREQDQAPVREEREKEKGPLLGPEHGGKIVLLLSILKHAEELGDKVLVFTQSLGTLDLIEQLLASDGWRWRKDRHWFRIDGSVRPKIRQSIVNHFNDKARNSAARCVLISTKAGALGINLQAANRVVIVDGSWNPTHDLQAMYRAWRYGQEKPVYVYRLLASGTMEEKIYNRQVVKESLAARVVDKHQVGRHLKADDLLLLVALDDDGEDETHKDGREADAAPSPGPTAATAAAAAEGAAGAADVAEGGTQPSTAQARKSIARHFAIPSGVPPRDEVMSRLLAQHHPTWIVRYHDHEPLLKDLEEEQLSLEDQEIAWQQFSAELGANQAMRSSQMARGLTRQLAPPVDGDDWMELVESVSKWPTNNGGPIFHRVSRALQLAGANPAVGQDVVAALQAAVSPAVYKSNSAKATRDMAMQALNLHRITILRATMASAS